MSCRQVRKTLPGASQRGGEKFKVWKTWNGAPLDQLHSESGEKLKEEQVGKRHSPASLTVEKLVLLSFPSQLLFEALPSFLPIDRTGRDSVPITNAAYTQHR